MYKYGVESEARMYMCMQNVILRIYVVLTHVRMRVDLHQLWVEQGWSEHHHWKVQLCPERSTVQYMTCTCIYMYNVCTVFPEIFAWALFPHNFFGWGRIAEIKLTKFSHWWKLECAKFIATCMCCDFVDMVQLVFSHHSPAPDRYLCLRGGLQPSLQQSDCTTSWLHCGHYILL